MYLAKFWINFKIFVKTLWACNFSIIMLILGAVIFLFIPQGKDTILKLEGFGHVIFVLAALIWALQIWYWARVMYYLKYRKVKKRINVVQWTVRLAPRILGGLALLTIAISAFIMSHYSPGLLWIGVLFIILTVLFLLFVIFRRDVFNLKKLDDDSLYNIKKMERKTKIALIPGLPKGASITTTISIIFAVLLFILFIIFPHIFVFFTITAALILLCFSMWVSIGSFISYFSYRVGLPLFSLLIILSLIFSFWNNNHSVRLLKNDTVPESPHLTQRINDFLKAYKNNKNNSNNPIYVVVAEGGGIRAAYWTAGVLGAIQDKDKNFKDNLFAISSVSGGSLGAAVFVTLIKKQSGKLPEKAFYVNKSREILRNDFLSPVIAGFFSGDILQEIIPLPIYSLSRGNAIEKAWELAWKKSMGSDDLKKPFKSLWKNDEECKIPLLFLNGTWAETGKRLIASYVQIDDEIFKDASDIYTDLKNDMRISTAVHNSARFPYICPAGRLNYIDHMKHVVDGGYFDNSGAITGLEITSALKNAMAERQIKAKLVVIMIKNSPKEQEKKQSHFFPGSIIPVIAILNIRTAHASYAVMKLKEYVNNKCWGRFIEIEPEPEDVHFPLGWALSGEVMVRLDEQIKEKVEELEF